jgi:hypothetical protein
MSTRDIRVLYEYARNTKSRGRLRDEISAIYRRYYKGQLNEYFARAVSSP